MKSYIPFAGAIVFFLLFAQRAIAQSSVIEMRNAVNSTTAMYYCDDDQNYRFVSYYDNQLKKETGNVKNGLRHGTWKMWNENGTLMAVAKFKNGQKTGKWKFISYDGQTVMRLTYDNDVLMHSEIRTQMTQICENLH